MTCEVGQGTIADREHENLGATGVSVKLFRERWARELRAVAEGRALRQWTYADQLVVTTGV